jgi:hypothetical protein
MHRAVIVLPHLHVVTAMIAALHVLTAIHVALATQMLVAVHHAVHAVLLKSKAF